MRTVTCLVCGTDFETSAARNWICSAECRRARRRAREAGVSEPGLPPPQRTCEVCQKAFPAVRSAKTCSPECRLVRQRERWRQDYYALDDDARKAALERARQRRADDPEYARELDRRKWQRVAGDPAQRQKVREGQKRHYEAHASEIQERRRQKREERLAAMTPEEREAFLERQRQYTREHRARERADPVAGPRRKEYEALHRQGRRAEETQAQLQDLAGQLQARADGEAESRVKPCVVCGAPVVGKHSTALTCSDECWRRHRCQMLRPPRVLACQHCGKEFSPRTAARFCSARCRMDARNEQKRGGKPLRQPKPPKEPTVPRPCIVCEQVFLPNRKNGVTCSPECRVEYKRRVERGRARPQEESP